MLFIFHCKGLQILILNCNVAAELRVEALVKQYEELKKEGAGRIQRHLKRRQQKVKKRSHKAPTGVS